jgi:NitT/TauT family transport system substrate-binding protein
MRFGRFRRAAFGVLAVALAASGCSGRDDSTSAPKTLEKTELRVGVLPIIDDAPLYIAIQKGYFANEGLKVTPQVVQGGALALPKLARGGLDISFVNYVSVFKAQADGGKYHILAEGYQAKPNVMGIVALNNKIAEPKDLAGKTIAVNTKGNVGTLTIASALSTSDVTPGSVKFKEVPFPDMAKTLQAGQVDAAWMVEPFITSAAQTLGAQLVLDTASGPTADLPVAGYVSTASFAERYPRTVAAFRRAMHRAQLAATDRQNVERVLPSYVPRIDPETAVITSVGVFPATDEPSPVRLQRVADLMQQFQLLSSRLDVKNLTE